MQSGRCALSENPGTLPAMDIVQFVWRSVSIPTPHDHHSYYRHDHYRIFDQARAREEWRGEVNEILRRNAVALELEDTGAVARIGPASAQIALDRALPLTGDQTLDDLLETAVRSTVIPTRLSAARRWNSSGMHSNGSRPF